METTSKILWYYLVAPTALHSFVVVVLVIALIIIVVIIAAIGIAIASSQLIFALIGPYLVLLLILSASGRIHNSLMLRHTTNLLMQSQSNYKLIIQLIPKFSLAAPQATHFTRHGGILIFHKLQAHNPTDPKILF